MYFNDVLAGLNYIPSFAQIKKWEDSAMEYKIKIYDDKRIVVTKNYNPFANRQQ